jgi:hypothetical protein
MVSSAHIRRAGNMTTTGILMYVAVKGAGQICLILDNVELSPEMVNCLPEDLRERLITGDEVIPVRVVYLRDKSLAEYKVELVVIDDQERVVSVKAEPIDNYPWLELKRAAYEAQRHHLNLE